MDIETVEKKIRAKVEKYLEKSGGFLNNGNDFGICVVTGEFYENYPAEACLVGALLWGEKLPNDYTDPKRIAAEMLGVPVECVRAVEHGYAKWEAGRARDLGLPQEYLDLGKQLRKDYYETV